MRSLEYRLRKHYIIERSAAHSLKYNEEKMEEADLIIVNGEGTMHHRNKFALFLMEVLKEAKARKKKAWLINAVYQAMGDYSYLIKKLDLVITREIRSHKAIQSGDMMLDSCADPEFLAGLNANPKPSNKKVFFGRIHKGSKIHVDCHWDRVGLGNQFSDTIRMLKDNCSIYITGQHHGVYAAGLAGIPFVAISSNSHKIEGLIEWSGLNIPICYGEGDIKKCFKFARENSSVFKEFNKFLLSKKVFGEV